MNSSAGVLCHTGLTLGPLLYGRLPWRVPCFNGDSSAIAIKTLLGSAGPDTDAGPALEPTVGGATGDRCPVGGLMKDASVGLPEVAGFQMFLTSRIWGTSDNGIVPAPP